MPTLKAFDSHPTHLVEKPIYISVDGAKDIERAPHPSGQSSHNSFTGEQLEVATYSQGTGEVSQKASNALLMATEECRAAAAWNKAFLQPSGSEYLDHLECRNWDTGGPENDIDDFDEDCDDCVFCPQCRGLDEDDDDGEEVDDNDHETCGTKEEGQSEPEQTSAAGSVGHEILLSE